MINYIISNVINEEILPNDLRVIINSKLYKVIELLELKLD